MMTHMNVRLDSSFVQRLWRGGICVILVLLACEVRAQEASIEQAKAAYQSADYDTAIRLFSDVAQDASADKEAREEAFKYLGRAYLVKDATDEAREAVANLIALEPPIVELNPDVEPPPLMKLYYEVRKEKSGDYRVERADPGLQTLAIMDFTNNSIDENERFDPMRQGFPSLLIDYLNGATDLKVIERERIQWLLNELELQRQADVVDQSTAVRSGKLLGATSVLFGSFIVHQKRMNLNVRLVKVETGEILLTEKVMGDRDEFFELAEELSLQVSQAINVTLEETELGTRTQTKSLDAQISFSEGLRLEEQGDYQAAHQKYRDALEYDPNFQKAQLRANRLQPFIAQAGTGDGSSGTSGR